MPYRLTQFGTTLLPLAGASFGLNPGRSLRQLVPLADGRVFDAQRSDEAPIRLPNLIDLEADLIEGTVGALRTTYEALSGLVGVRDRLWRATVDGYYHWCWAEVSEIPAQRGPQNTFWQPVRLGFTQAGYWNGQGYGGGALFDDGYYFDSGLWFDSEGATTLDGSDDISLVNAGNRPVTDVGITLTAGDNPVTSLALTIADVAQLTWTGTLAATKSLIIDCGVRAVLNNGVGDWQGLTVGPNHYSPYWLPIAKSATTTVHVVVDGLSEFGVNPTIQFTYADGWK